MGEKPSLSGEIQKKDGDNYKKIGDIALWPNDSDNEKAPDFKGNIQIGEDQQFPISVWDRREGKSEQGSLKDNVVIDA